MTDLSQGVLIDTTALIALVTGDKLDPKGQAALKALDAMAAVYVSAATGWEVGQMAARKGAAKVTFEPGPEAWYGRVLTELGFVDLPLTAQIAMAAANLPGKPPADPAARFMIASALSLGVPVLTRDPALLAYAAAGHVTAIPC